MLNKIGNILCIILGVTIIILSLLACEPAIKEGTVVDKVYEPERTWTSVTFMSVNNMLIPITTFHKDDEDWILIVQNKNENGDNKQRRVYVTKDIFNNTEEGSWYNIEKQNSDKIETTRLE